MGPLFSHLLFLLFLHLPSVFLHLTFLALSLLTHKYKSQIQFTNIITFLYGFEKGLQSRAGNEPSYSGSMQA